MLTGTTNSSDGVIKDLYLDDDGDGRAEQWTPPPGSSAATSSLSRSRKASSWTNQQRGAALLIIVLIIGAVVGLFVVNSNADNNDFGVPPTTHRGDVGDDDSSLLDSSSTGTGAAGGDNNNSGGSAGFGAVTQPPADAARASTAANIRGGGPDVPTAASIATTAATAVADKLTPPRGPPLVAVESSTAPSLTSSTWNDASTTTEQSTATTAGAQVTAAVSTEAVESTALHSSAEATGAARTLASTGASASTSIAPTVDPAVPTTASTTTTTTATSSTTTRAFWFNCGTSTSSASARMYTSAESIAAQPDGFPYNLPAAAWQEQAVVLPHSTANMLRTLIWIPTPEKEDGGSGGDDDGSGGGAGAGCVAVPVARSYAGYEWEGLMPTPVHPDCIVKKGGRHECTINVTGHADGVYIIHTASRSNSTSTDSNNDDDGDDGDEEGTAATTSAIRMPTNADAASRLLVQATFGPSKASIAKVLQGVNGSNPVNDTDVAVARAWVEAEMKKPVSYHRAYLRKRQNPRVVGESYAGTIIGTCERGARWHRYAFNELDESATLVVVSLPLRGRFALKVNGVLRTETSQFLKADWSANSAALTKYRICYIEERVGGVMKIVPIDPDNDVLDCGTKNLQYQISDVNPKIKFTVPDASTTQVYKSGEILLGPVTSALNKDSFFLKKRKTGVKCTGVKKAGKAFMGVQTKAGDGTDFYLEDPRMRMLSNTVESPADVDSDKDDGGDTGTCPVVAKTFINTGSCARRDEGTCSPLKYAAGHNINLDKETVRTFFTASNKYVFVVQGLRLTESKHGVSPCVHGRKSRWLRTPGQCKLAVLKNVEIAKTITAALNAEGARVGSNPNIRDLVVADFAETHGMVCTPMKVTVGSRVQLDGGCWQHSHPHERNVYDFGKWTTFHPGNPSVQSNRRNPIVAFAVDGKIMASYPAWHHIIRWDTYVDAGFFPYVGRFEDGVDFTSLPPALQTTDMAAYAGVPSTKDDVAFEACGSRAEVANVPALGHFFLSLGYLRPQGIDQKSFPLTDVYVWQNAVLNADDQLRQRVAWSLSQIFVVSAAELVSDENEAWVTFYDIFVHHAFGNYFDIMKEVSASPVMGKFLTFINNRAQSNGAYPDENYVR